MARLARKCSEIRSDFPTNILAHVRSQMSSGVRLGALAPAPAARSQAVGAAHDLIVRGARSAIDLIVVFASVAEPARAACIVASPAERPENGIRPEKSAVEISPGRAGFETPALPDFVFDICRLWRTLPLMRLAGPDPGGTTDRDSAALYLPFARRVA